MKVYGEPGENPGQLYFVTSAITETIRSDAASSKTQTASLFSGYKNPFDPLNWVSNSLNLWEKNWNYFTKLPFNYGLPQSPKPKNKREDAIMDSETKEKLEHLFQKATESSTNRATTELTQAHADLHRKSAPPIAP